MFHPAHVRNGLRLHTGTDHQHEETCVFKGPCKLSEVLGYGYTEQSEHMRTSMDMLFGLNSLIHAC